MKIINLNEMFPNKKLLASFKNGKELRIELKLNEKDEIKLICDETKVVSSSFLSGLFHLHLFNDKEYNIDINEASNQIKSEYKYSKKRSRIERNQISLENRE